MQGKTTTGRALDPSFLNFLVSTSKPYDPERLLGALVQTQERSSFTSLSGHILDLSVHL